jgi:uronate dehydrogenase
LVTGARGTIGQVLQCGWPRDRFHGFDLPAGDSRDPAALTAAARGCEAIVHLAWDTRAENFRNRRLAPDNLAMALNALEAAAVAAVPRVILASSVHADGFWPPPPSPLDPARTPVPDSPYGASKVFVEALGRHFAAARGLEVVAVRFGGVNPADTEPPEASERAVWLPHRDCLDLVRTALLAPLGGERFRLVIGVGDGPHRVHAYGADPLWPPPSRPAES